MSQIVLSYYLSKDKRQSEKFEPNASASRRETCSVPRRGCRWRSPWCRRQASGSRSVFDKRTQGIKTFQERTKYLIVE
ncbi:MAG: hypothetical protein KME40_02395 [Komarekiella atlantica HA4396-MV6]|nr:hypothetical protein [Komarekiella atlantica HA4396-MV6]